MKFKTDIVDRYMHNEGFEKMAQSENCSVNDIWEYLKKQDFKKAFKKLRPYKGRETHFWEHKKERQEYLKKYQQEHKEEMKSYRKKYYQKYKNLIRE